MVLELNVGFGGAPIIGWISGDELSSCIIFLWLSFNFLSLFLSTFRFLSTFYLPWCRIGYLGWVMGLILAFFHINIFRGRYTSIMCPNNIQFIPNTLLSFFIFLGRTVYAQVVQTRFTQHFGAVHLKNICSSSSWYLSLECSKWPIGKYPSSIF